MRQTLSKEAKKVFSDYYKKWRKENPDKARNILIRYWEKKAKELVQKDSKENGHIE